jgi:hypothetical protein
MMEVFPAPRNPVKTVIGMWDGPTIEPIVSIYMSLVSSLSWRFDERQRNATSPHHVIVYTFKRFLQLRHGCGINTEHSQVELLPFDCPWQVARTPQRIRLARELDDLSSMHRMSLRFIHTSRSPHLLLHCS